MLQFLDQISLNVACRRIKYWVIFSIGSIVWNNRIRTVIKDIQITGFDILIVDLLSIQCHCLLFDKKNNIENLLPYSGPGNIINRHNELQITEAIGESLHFVDQWTRRQFFCWCRTTYSIHKKYSSALIIVIFAS